MKQLPSAHQTSHHKYQAEEHNLIIIIQNIKDNQDYEYELLTIRDAAEATNTSLMSTYLNVSCFVPIF